MKKKIKTHVHNIIYKPDTCLINSDELVPSSQNRNMTLVCANLSSLSASLHACLN